MGDEIELPGPQALIRRGNVGFRTLNPKPLQLKFRNKQFILVYDAYFSSANLILLMAFGLVEKNSRR